MCDRISVLTTSQQPMIWSLEGKDEWDNWIQNVKASRFAH